jgi:hypothetical protein
MKAINLKRPTAIKGTLNNAKSTFSAEIFAGAIISRLQLGLQVTGYRFRRG